MVFDVGFRTKQKKLRITKFKKCPKLGLKKANWKL